MAVSLKSRVERRMLRKQTDVFTPKDFANLGGEDQVLRALRMLLDVNTSSIVDTPP